MTCSSFELFVAGRYLRARRKEKVISVITVISVIGVAAGVMALIISLAVNNGFQNTLQRNMLAATAHVNILEQRSGRGHRRLAEADREAAARCRTWSRSRRCSTIRCFSAGRSGRKLVTLKGIDTQARTCHQRHAATSQERVARTLEGRQRPARRHHRSKLAQDAGLTLNSVVTVIDPQGTLTPIRARAAQPALPRGRHFRNQLLRRRRQLGLCLARRRAEARFRRRRGQYHRNPARQSGSCPADGDAKPCASPARITARSPGKSRTSSSSTR